jgi:integrase
VIRQRFNRLILRLRLPVIRLHDLRHSYATAALSVGVHPKIVSERLGHASVAFTLASTPTSCLVSTETRRRRWLIRCSAGVSVSNPVSKRPPEAGSEGRSSW